MMLKYTTGKQTKSIRAFYSHNVDTLDVPEYIAVWCCNLCINQQPVVCLRYVWWDTFCTVELNNNATDCMSLRGINITDDDGDR